MKSLEHFHKWTNLVSCCNIFESHQSNMYLTKSLQFRKYLLSVHTTKVWSLQWIITEKAKTKCLSHQGSFWGLYFFFLKTSILRWNFAEGAFVYCRLLSPLPTYIRSFLSRTTDLAYMTFLSPVWHLIKRLIIITPVLMLLVLACVNIFWSD